MPCTLYDLPNELLQRIVEHALPNYADSSASGLRSRRRAIRTISRLNRASKRLYAVTVSYLWEHVTLPIGYRCDGLPECCVTFPRTIWWHGADILPGRGKEGSFPALSDLHKLRERFPKAHIVSYWWTSVSAQDRLLKIVKVDLSRESDIPLRDTHLQSNHHQPEDIEIGQDVDIPRLLPDVVWPPGSGWSIHGPLATLFLDLPAMAWVGGEHHRQVMTFTSTDGQDMSDLLASSARQIDEIIALRPMRTLRYIKLNIGTIGGRWDLNSRNDSCVKALEKAFSALQIKMRAPEATIMSYVDTGKDSRVLIIENKYGQTRTSIVKSWRDVPVD